MALLTLRSISGLGLIALMPWSNALASPSCDLPTLNPPTTLGQLDEMRHTVHIAKPSVPVNATPLETDDAPAAAAPVASRPHQADAAKVVAGLTREGFSCHLPTSSESERSYHCSGHVAGYSQPVDIYVPTAYRSQDKHSLAYHFVGWTNQAAFDPFTSQNGDYGSYFAQTKKNGILVIPRSAPGKDQTYTNELGKPAQVNAFFNTINRTLTAAGTPTDVHTPILISGHSGAGVEIGRLGKFAAAGSVPQLQHLAGVALFDSAYNASDVPGIVAAMGVMRQNGHAHLLAAYTPGAANAKENELIKRSLASNPKIQDELVHIAPDVSHTAHMAYMKKYMESFYSEALP